jgi:cytochrome c oxidase subunit 2
MFNDFPLWPEVASSNAAYVDSLFIFLIVVCGAMALMVFALVIYFVIKFRRRSENEVGEDYEPPKIVENLLIAVWLVAFLSMFAFGAKVYFDTSRPPNEATEIYGTGKQWMWKFQHTDGQSEINELHVVIGRPVKVILSSEDVIHSFYVPAFRVKKDALPGRYTTIWFTPIKTGRFHLFCAEYCGTEHSGMIGWIVVMEPSAYQTWAAGGSSEGSPKVQGKKLFEKYACNTCHTNDATGRGPVLAGLYGSTVTLRSGEQLQADDNYIRESIQSPTIRVVQGFQPIMPVFQGQLNEAEMMQLVAYVKSLAPPKGTAPAVESPASFRDSTGAPPSPGTPQQQKVQTKAK